MAAAAVNAQATNFKRVAEQFYAKGDYYSAAHYFEKYLSGKTPSRSGYNAYVVQKQGAALINTNDLGGLDGTLLYRMGDCYYNLNDFIHAEQWYKLLLKKDSSTFPLARFIMAFACAPMVTTTLPNRNWVNSFRRTPKAICIQKKQTRKLKTAGSYSNKCPMGLPVLKLKG